jgi:hypothetical protein
MCHFPATVLESLNLRQSRTVVHSDTVFSCFRGRTSSISEICHALAPATIRQCSVDDRTIALASGYLRSASETDFKLVAQKLDSDTDDTPQPPVLRPFHPNDAEPLAKDVTATRMRRRNSGTLQRSACRIRLSWGNSHASNSRTA